MSMDTSTSGGRGGDDDIKVKNVSDIINCSLYLARELLANCGGDVNQVIDTFCGSGSQNVEKKEKSKLREESLSAFYEDVEEGRGDKEDHRVKCLLCNDGRLVHLSNFSHHLKEIHEPQVPSQSVKKNEVDLESAAAKRPSHERSVTSGGISSMLKRKKPPVESIITIDDSDEDENPDDENTPEKKKFKKLREELSDYLVNVRKAGYMSKGEEDRMTLEDCPKCTAPQILPDKRVSLYNCPECGAVTCRKCLLQAHSDRKCEEGKEEDEEVKEVDVEYKKITVLPSRNFDMDNDLDREFRIAEGQFLRMAGAKRKCYEIKSIDVVYNKKLKEKFDAKKQELKRRGMDDKPLLIFHGTPQENIEPILRENFDLSKVANGRKFGNGVYFSEMPDVSLGYSLDQSSLILCLVLQGNNTREVSNPAGIQDVDNQKSKSGAWAIVVPDVDQILPKYVINFVDKPKDKRNRNVQSLGPGSGIWGGLGSMLPPGALFNHASWTPISQSNFGAGSSGSAQQQGNLVAKLHSQLHNQLHSQHLQYHQGPSALGPGPLPGQHSAGSTPGGAQNVPVPHTYKGICHVCNVEFNSEDAMNNHMRGANHMRQELALMRNMVQPVAQGQAGNITSQHPPNQGDANAPNQHMLNYPWVHTPAPSIAPGGSQNMQQGPVPHSYQGYCHLCKVEFTSEDAMKSHMMGSKHMKEQIKLETRMGNLVHPMNQGQAGSSSSQHPPTANAPIPNQHNCPWVHTPALGLPAPASGLHTPAPGIPNHAASSLADQLLNILSQGRGTSGPQMVAPQMIKMTPPTKIPTQIKGSEVKGRMEAVAQRSAEQVEADARMAASSSSLLTIGDLVTPPRVEMRAAQVGADAWKTPCRSFPTFKDQEPKFKKVKLLVEEVDSSGTPVSGSRVDLANCRDLYCALCDMWMTSKKMMWVHKQGGEHIKQMMEVNKKDEKHGKDEKDAE